MSSSKPRNLFRGWNRHESYWDSEGMNENLQFLEGHVPFNIVGQYPANPSAPREGDVVIRKANGTYKIWQTGLNVQAPTWVEYPAIQGLLGFDARTNKLWFNDGSIWKDETEIGLATLTAVATAITAHENATNPHPQYATIDQLNTAINSLEDLHLVGWQSYNSTTNTLTAIMSDGTTVAVDLTALVNDAITTIPTATDTVKGIVENATTVEVGEGILDGAVSISPANLLGALIASPNNALQDAIRAVSKTFVADGTNTTVTGDGTVATPYQVSVPEATRTVKGVVQLVKGSDFPAQQTSETLGVSPSYVKQVADQLQTSLTNSLTGSLAINGFDEGTSTGAVPIKNINVTGDGATATQLGDVLRIDVPAVGGASVTTGTDVVNFDSDPPTDGNVFYRNEDTGELWFYDGDKWSAIGDLLYDEGVLSNLTASTAAGTYQNTKNITAARSGTMLLTASTDSGATATNNAGLRVTVALNGIDVVSDRGTSEDVGWRLYASVAAPIQVQAGDIVSITQSITQSAAGVNTYTVSGQYHWSYI